MSLNKKALLLLTSIKFLLIITNYCSRLHRVAAVLVGYPFSLLWRSQENALLGVRDSVGLSIIITV